MSQTLPPVTPTPPSVIAEKIRSDEFFREAHLEYHRKYDDIMAERYMYVAITAIASLICILALVATSMFFPLSSKVPFVYSTNDSVNELPRMVAIGDVKDNVNDALIQFLVTHYTTARESYDPDRVDFNAAIMKDLSSADVFKAYTESIDPRNPDSPISRFQRRATRSISIESVAYSNKNGKRQAEVFFEATIREGLLISKERARANITFSFDEITVDQQTGETTPLVFKVEAYERTVR